MFFSFFDHSVFSRGHATLHLAVSVGRSVRPSHFWIAIGSCITAPAQPSATVLPCIRPCFCFCFHLGNLAHLAHPVPDPESSSDWYNAFFLLSCPFWSDLSCLRVCWWRVVSVDEAEKSELCKRCTNTASRLRYRELECTNWLFIESKHHFMRTPRRYR